MRNLSAAMISTLASGRVRPFYLVEMDFASGTLYAWTGVGSITWNGHTWLGFGKMCSVSAIQDTNQVQANNVTLSLNGIPSDLITDAMSECEPNRPVILYLGFLDDTGAIVTDPEKCFSGRMDVPTVTDGPDTCSIAITAENLLTFLQRASNRRYTTPDQHIDFSTDIGFNYVPSIQTWDGIWGKAGSSVGGKKPDLGLILPGLAGVGRGA